MSQTPKEPYKAPFVYIGTDDAFVSVSWYCRNSDIYKREKLRLGIKGLTKSKRKVLLNELCSKITEVVKHRNQSLIYHDDNIFGFEEKKYNDGDIISCFEFFKNDIENPKYQREQSQAFIKRFNAFLEIHKSIKSTKLSNLSKVVVKEYIKYLQSLTLTGKTINTHLWVLGKVVAKVSEGINSKIDLNTDELRVKQLKNETELYKPLSFGQKDLIFSFFSSHTEKYYQNYAIFLYFLYYTCIRPAEIMRIQLKYINLKDRTIYIPWYKSKNGLSNYVQILEPLYNVLIKMKLEQYPDDYFLFSHKFEPGPIKKTSKNVSELWLIAVRFLKIIDRQMYGMKGTFNKDYVENNKKDIDWEWLRRHNRHATVQQTQDYISGLTAYFLDEEKNIILDHT